MVVSDAIKKQAILVTHGYGGHRLVMWPLCRRLRKLGYRVTNWGYRSLWKDTGRHADAFLGQLRKLEEDQDVETFFVVAHSMGSVVTRAALSKFQPEKLKRIVMIAPPNHGSPIASMYAPLFGWLSKTLIEISDAEDSFVRQLSDQIDPDYEVGVLQAQTDFVVPTENTRLPEAKEYVMLPGFHSSVVFHQRTADQVHNFLQTGEFLSRLPGSLESTNS